MILAGDIGGTHTRIALFEATALSQARDKLVLILEQVYPSREHQGLHEILQLFMQQHPAQISSACFGIAGPVISQVVSTPNLPWVIDGAQLSEQTGINPLWLINDLHAHASGIDDLAPSDLVPLNSAVPIAGNSALIAAGTGLGQAGLYWDGAIHHAFPGEGGHCDFAPRNDLEVALLQYLIRKFGRVSYERILSGPGLHNIYDFLRDSHLESEPPALRAELAQAADGVAIISQHALIGDAAICQRALSIFVQVYGAEAGNLALKMLATGGVFISGGIAGKILPRLQAPEFLEAFVAKGRLRPLMETIPVKVIINDSIGLLGAARYAQLMRTALVDVPAIQARNHQHD
jgi:glucokinase